MNDVESVKRLKNRLRRQLSRGLWTSVRTENLCRQLVDRGHERSLAIIVIAAMGATSAATAQ